MVNKLSIENAYKHDPFKSYFVIKNPKWDRKNKKVRFLEIKVVEYKVDKWDKNFIYFKKVNTNKNKKYPDIIELDKRYPDAENEIIINKHTGKSEETMTKQSLSIAIFAEKTLAKYHKLIRLHRLAQDFKGIYKALKNQADEIPINEDDDEVTKEAKKGIDPSKVDISIEEIANLFEDVQNTDYFEKLEEIQAENPSLATK